MNKVALKRKISPRVANGHPWIFGNEIEKSDGDCKAGDVVEVYSHDGKFIGTGYYNPQSQIMVRLLSRKKNEAINEQFFFDKIKYFESLWAPLLYIKISLI